MKPLEQILAKSLWATTVVAFISCTNTPSDSSSQDEEQSSTAGGGVITSGKVEIVPLNKIYPTELSLFSPYILVNGSDNLDSTKTFYDYKLEIASVWKTMNSTTVAECARDFSVVAEEPEKPTCYGPAIDYQGHPDGSPISGSYARNELAIWSASESNSEGCAAAKINEVINQDKRYVDLGLNAIQMLICVGQINYVEPPLVTDPYDMTETMQAVSEGLELGGSIENATITKVVNDDGDIYYESSISIKRTDESVLQATVSHHYIENNNSLYQGQYWMTLSPKDGDTNSKIFATSIAYHKNATDHLYLNARSGRFPALTELDAIFAEDHQLKVSVDDSGYLWGIYGFNPKDMTGDYSVLWTDKAADKNVRSSRSEITKNTDGILSSCAYMGFGDTLSAIYLSETQSNWIDRMICNPTGPNADLEGAAYLQKQCMNQSSVSGIYEVSESKVTFVPRNSCGESNEVSDGFSWRMTGDTEVDFSRLPGQHNLESISSIDIEKLSVPAKP